MVGRSPTPVGVETDKRVHSAEEHELFSRDDVAPADILNRWNTVQSRAWSVTLCSFGLILGFTFMADSSLKGRLAMASIMLHSTLSLSRRNLFAACRRRR